MATAHDRIQPPRAHGASTAEAVLPLTSMQEGMLYQHVAAPAADVDLEQILMVLREPVDATSLRAAWESVARRHAALRTAFRWRGVAAPVQEVLPAVDIDLIEEDWRGLAPAERAPALDELLARDRRTTFDPASAPLWRVRLVRFGESDARVLWTFHHILMDGRSFPIVLTDLFACLDAQRTGAVAALPPAAPLADYLAWAGARDAAGDEPYWRARLRGLRGPTRLGSVVEARGAAASRRHAERVLDAAASDRIRFAAARHGVPVSTLVQGAWALLLSRLVRERDVVFGVTRAGRGGTVANARAMVGLLINTLPVRADADGAHEPGAWLRGLRAVELSSRPFEHAALADIQRWSDVPAGGPLFDSIVVFDRARLGPALRARGGAWLQRDFVLHERAPYPVTLYAYDEPRLVLRLAWDEPVLADGGAALLDALHAILDAFADPGCRRLADIPLVPHVQWRTLVARLDARAPVPFEPCCVQDLFRRQAARTPDAVALRHDDAAVTYGALDEASDALAARLRALGVGPDVAVGLHCTRGTPLVVGLLGILKAGGAWVPLDPAHPAERHAAMLADAAARVLVTAGATPPPFAGPIVDLDATRPVLSPVPRAGTRPEHAAYIMFTSGSTGRPKGVVVEHRNVVNFFAAMDAVVPIAARRTWLAVTSPAFDISVLELLWTLTRGFEVVIEPDGPHRAGTLIGTYAVSHLQCTPSRARMLLADAETRAALRGLDVFLVGGEPLRSDVAQALRAAVGGRVINLYGPTETTVWSSAHEVAAGAGAVEPIGRPIANTTFLVMHEEAGLVPPGVPGELWIGGAGVARGYVGRPDLTHACFVADPLGGAERFYRTGDLVRWRADGVVEFLGRIDDQVKVRGHRVEPAEIEAVLCSHADVTAAAVLAQADAHGEVALHAWYVVRNGGPAPDARALREWLGSALPPAMVPATLTALQALPLTRNGKVDRLALRQIRAAPSPEREPARAPRSRLEAEVASIWRDVLGIAHVTADDNFFDLGGHSLLAVRVHDRLQRATGRTLPLILLFRHPTVRTLAAALEEGAPDGQDELRVQAQRAAALRHALSSRRAFRPPGSDA